MQIGANGFRQEKIILFGVKASTAIATAGTVAGFNTRVKQQVLVGKRVF
jgi:hypothetical protein